MIILTSDKQTKKNAHLKPHPGCLEVPSILKMITKDELPKNLTITKTPFQKRPPRVIRKPQKPTMSIKCNFSYSNLLEIKPIWALALQPPCFGHAME
jgi:predicted metal-dependent RNase